MCISEILLQNYLELDFCSILKVNSKTFLCIIPRFLLKGG